MTSDGRQAVRAACWYGLDERDARPGEQPIEAVPPLYHVPGPQPTEYWDEGGRGGNAPWSAAGLSQAGSRSGGIFGSCRPGWACARLEGGMACVVCRTQPIVSVALHYITPGGSVAWPRDHARARSLRGRDQWSIRLIRTFVSLRTQAHRGVLRRSMTGREEDTPGDVRQRCGKNTHRREAIPVMLFHASEPSRAGRPTICSASRGRRIAKAPLITVDSLATEP
jgi:hypothetical protein